MSYALRNTIVLGSFLFVVFAVGGYFSFFHYPGKINELEASLRQIDAELQNTPNLLNERNSLEATVETTKTQWATRIKSIPAADVASETYDYLIKTIDQSGRVKMDMLYNGVKGFERHGFGIYDLKGDATFAEFFRFLWFIEHGRQLYKIRTIELRQAWTKEEESLQPILLISYRMIVDAYYSTISELSIATGQRSLQPTRLALNPFYPFILPEIPANTLGLVEIKRSNLKGVIVGKAYVQDQDNKIRELSEGDEIYLGYISKIDPERGSLEYVLNEGGIIDKGELTIREGYPINQ